MSDHIPDEILDEIFKKLPIRSLIKFRCVSKQWKSLIESSNFIADYTVRNHDQHRLLVMYTDPSSNDICVSIRDDETFPRNKFSHKVPPSVHMFRDPMVVGTSHGVFCLFGCIPHQGEFDPECGFGLAVLWNPSINKSVAIDLFGVDWPVATTFGFGVCPVTCDPKIVKIDDMRMHRKLQSVSGSSRWRVEVFTLSSRVWRRSFGNLHGNFDEFKRPHSQVAIDGFIYWFGIVKDANYRCHVLISFDLSSEEFGEMQLPVQLAPHDPKELFLYKRRDSLAVLKRSVRMRDYEVWMMENDGSMLFVKRHIVRPYQWAYESGLPQEFRTNGELLVSVRGYYDDSESIPDLGIKVRHGSVFVSSYTESLILLDQKRRFIG